MGPLNDLGLLKMDFLGLKTLTVIEDTLTLIRKRDRNFSLKDIPLDDAAAFALYNRGETVGLFQMESGGMEFSNGDPSDAAAAQVQKDMLWI